jgi:Fe-S cluster assembly iron-binding protein IscA
MSIVKLDPRAYQAIMSELLERKLRPFVRIEICSTGCCDASLGLRPDKADVSDLVEEVDDLTLLINPEVYALVGVVSISCADEVGRSGFILTSQRPLNEWEGFAVCDMKK